MDVRWYLSSDLLVPHLGWNNSRYLLLVGHSGASRPGFLFHTGGKSGIENRLAGWPAALHFGIPTQAVFLNMLCCCASQWRLFFLFSVIRWRSRMQYIHHLHHLSRSWSQIRYLIDRAVRSLAAMPRLTLPVGGPGLASWLPNVDFQFL